MSTFNPNRLQGFVPDDHNLPALQEKLQRFRDAPNSSLSVVTDWADTAAEGTWPILRSSPNVMKPGISQYNKQLFLRVREALETGRLDDSDAHAWQAAALGHLVGSRLVDITSAARQVQLRPGTKEFFDLCKERGIPVIIKTADVEQFVLAAAEANGITPDLVISTRLLEQDGQVVGWEPATMTHPNNKGDVSHEKLAELQREHVVLLGDGLLDRRMVPLEQDALLIRANGGLSDDPSARQEYLAASFNTEGGERPYDLVCVEPDLVAVQGLMNWLTSPDAAA